MVDSLTFVVLFSIHDFLLRSRLLGQTRSPAPVLRPVTSSSEASPAASTVSHGSVCFPRSLRRIPRHSPRSLLLARRAPGVPNPPASVTSDPRDSLSPLPVIRVSCVFKKKEQLLNRLRALIASPFYRLVVWVAPGLFTPSSGFFPAPFCHKFSCM